MRYRMIPTLLSFLLTCGCQAGAKNQGQGEVSESGNYPEIVQSALPAAAASNGLAIDLYTRLAASGDNIFFSPASISVALAMTRLGAREQTASEMDQVLHFEGVNPDVIHASYQALLSFLRSTQGLSELRLANRLFGAEGFTFLPDFLARAESYYGASFANLDFQGDPEGSRKDINDWVEYQTKEKIKNLLPDGSITPETVMVLVNAIYFLSTWDQSFDPEATRRQPFHLGGSVPAVEADLMHSTHSTWFFEGDGLKLLVLPYADPKLEFVALLPDELDGIRDLEKQLTPEKLQGWISGAENRKVQIALPRFKLDSEFSLNQALVDLGMSSAFRPKGANFTGMTSNAGLYISKVVHKAVISLDEQGSEAAAATGVTIAVTSVSPDRDPTFIADHPFIFLIRHRDTGAILFMGRLANPS